MSKDGERFARTKKIYHKVQKERIFHVSNEMNALIRDLTTVAITENAKKHQAKLTQTHRTPV